MSDRSHRSEHLIKSSSLPTASDSLNCPTTTQNRRRVYFRLFESMDLPWILIQREMKKGSEYYRVTNCKRRFAISQPTTELKARLNSRMFICFRKLSIIHCSNNQLERSKYCLLRAIGDRLPYHLYIFWHTDANKFYGKLADCLNAHTSISDIHLRFIFFQTIKHKLYDFP